jgi:hypothetical protein
MTYEVHITCDVRDRAIVDRVSEIYSWWKTSEIARDIVLGEKTYMYLTSHYREKSVAFERLAEAVDLLKRLGCLVVREKIELIIYDTKVKNGQENSI